MAKLKKICKWKSYSFPQRFLWIFGIHGAQVIGPILEPCLLIASKNNRIEYLAGNELPNKITYKFLYNYIFIEWRIQ